MKLFILRHVLPLFGLGLAHTHAGDAAASAPSLTISPTPRVSLNGTWKFAADYQGAGDIAKWFAPSYNDGVWDHVTVPHTWSHDPRFMGFIGAGWYRLRFTAPAVPAGRHARLRLGVTMTPSRIPSSASCPHDSSNQVGNALFAP